MTQEDKAKAYDEMTRLLSNWYKNETDIGIKDHISAIYPEIAESADEKIRKRLIEEMRRFQEEAAKESCDADFEFAKKAIAWLEKQGEQKSKECLLEEGRSGEEEEKLLKFVGKGDIVAFYEEWKGEKRRCLMLVKSYDYGNGDMTVSAEHPYGASAPRCIWGLCCTGTWYGDWVPNTHEFFKATEEEKQLLIDKMPDDVRARAIELNLIPSK